MPSLVIEVLYVQHCPCIPGALSLVHRICAELGVDAEVRTILVTDQAAAERARSRGSWEAIAARGAGAASRGVGRGRSGAGRSGACRSKPNSAWATGASACRAAGSGSSPGSPQPHTG